MKTTIDLPEEILHRAKIVAAQRRTTLKELVIQGLCYAMAHPPGSEEEPQLEKAKRLLQALGRIELSGPVGRFRREEIYDRDAGKWES